jgi:hypothetical protein
LGAFQKLIDYHIEWYTQHPKDIQTINNVPDTHNDVNGNLRLSSRKKRDILVNNIYGVDIDRRAVEVTQMSLYLKVLENENADTLNPQMTLALKEVYLPSLADNIKCGNSLIGTDFGAQGEMFDDGTRMKINPFDWEMEFKEIMRPSSGSGGGFDCIVGNPPYRMLQPHNTDDNTLQYLRSRFVSAEFKIDLFHLFLQKGISLLKKTGKLSYIVPSTLLNNVYAENLRKWILSECRILSISVSRGKVFEDADVHTSVIVVEKENAKVKRESNEINITSQLDEKFVQQPHYESTTLQKSFINLPGSVWNILVNEKNFSLIEKLNHFESLGKVASINRGLITGDRDKFFSNKKKSKDYVPIITGSDVQRYFVNAPSEYVLFKKPASAGGCWDRDVHFSPHKLVIRQIVTRPTASILLNPIAVTGNIFTIIARDVDDEIYLLGLINSSPLSYYWKTMFSDFKDSFPQVTIFSLEQLPVRRVDFQNPSEKKQHNDLVALVEKMLDLHKQIANSNFDSEKEPIERQIKSTDKKIDQLVYQLYGLTEEEIKVVEGEAI